MGNICSNPTNGETMGDASSNKKRTKKLKTPMSSGIDTPTQKKLALDDSYSASDISKKADGEQSEYAQYLQDLKSQNLLGTVKISRRTIMYTEESQSKIGKTTSLSYSLLRADDN